MAVLGGGNQMSTSMYTVIVNMTAMNAECCIYVTDTVRDMIFSNGEKLSVFPRKIHLSSIYLVVNTHRKNSAYS